MNSSCFVKNKFLYLIHYRNYTRTATWLVMAFLTWYLKQRSEYLCKMQIIVFSWFFFFSSSSSVHHGIIPVNNQLDEQFFLYMFISILYMFRATVCSSSGESIVSIRHLAYVTLCGWSYAGVDGTSTPAYQTITRIEWHMPNVVLIQLILLMTSTQLLETCRVSK